MSKKDNIENKVAVSASRSAIGSAARSISKTLFCPECGTRHFDEGVWKTKSHKTHQCQNCFHEWRPFSFPTIGV